MPTPAHSIVFWAPPYSGTSIALGNVIIPTTDSTAWLVSTSANRGTRRSEGIAISVTNATGQGMIEIQQAGTVDASITGLGTSTGWVRASTAGLCELFTPNPGGTSDIIGYVDNGRLHLMMGVLTESIASAIGGLAPFNVGTAPRPTNAQGFNWGIADGAGTQVLIAADQSGLTNKSVISGTSDAGIGVSTLTFGYNTAGAADTRTYLLGDSIFLQGGSGSISLASSVYAGSTRAGNWSSRFCVGGNAVTGPDSTYASFGNSIGPIMMLGGILTEPTTTPNDGGVGNDKKAVRIWLNPSVNLVRFQFPSGNICSIPDFNGTLPTSGWTSPTGTGFATVTAGVLDAAALAFPLAVAKGGTNLTALPGASGEILYNLSGGFSAATNVTTGSGFIGIGSGTLPTVGSLRFPYNAGVAYSIIEVKDSTATDRSVINYGAGDTLTIGNSAQNLNFAGVGSTWTFSGSFALSTSGTNTIDSDSTKFGISKPLSGSSPNSLPLRLKRAQITQSSTADTTLSSSQYECVVIDVTGTPGGVFNIIGPSVTDSFFIVSNGTPSTLTVKKAAGTGVAIATLKTALIRHNGTDYVRVTADA